eukprot:1012135_1
MPINDHHGDVIAAVQVINKSGGGDFSDHFEEMLKAFESPISIAISNCKLFEETEKALNGALLECRTQKFMLLVIKNLSCMHNTGKMMASMTSLVGALFRCDHCYMYLVDHKLKEFFRVDQGANRSHSFSRGIVGSCIRRQAAIRIAENASQRVDFDPTVDAANHPVEGLLCMPIIIKKPRDEDSSEDADDVDDFISEVVGVMMVEDENIKHGFNAEEEDLLQVFCDLVAIAVSNMDKLNDILRDVEARTIDISGLKYLNQERGMKLAAHDISAFNYTKNDIALKQSIGKGSYGEVFLGKVRGIQEDVAIKQITVKNLGCEEIEDFCNETALMVSLDHPNVVKFIGAICEPPMLSIITEFCGRGSLTDILLDHRVPITDLQKSDFLLDAARGMHYLHNCRPPIFHRDLKSDNLIVCGDWLVKVCDFGLTQFCVETSEEDSSQVGTPMWMAPEVIKQQGFTKKSDVYSYGIIMWEVMTRLEPYEDKEVYEIVLEVMSNKLRPEIPVEYRHHRLVRLMKDCWMHNPDDRPNFQAIIERLEKIRMHFL